MFFAGFYEIPAMKQAFTSSYATRKHRVTYFQLEKEAKSSVVYIFSYTSQVYVSFLSLRCDSEVPSPIPTQPLRLVFYKLIRRSKRLCVAARLIAGYQSRIWMRVCGAAQ